MFRKITVCLFALLIFQTSLVAGEFESPAKIEYQQLYGKEFNRNFQLGIALGMRVDEQEYFRFSPLGSFNLFYNISPVVALRTEFGLAKNRQELQDKTISRFHTGVSIRLKDMRSLFSTFVELGINHSWYVNNTADTKQTIRRFGFKFAIGVELKLSKSILADFSFTQMLQSVTTNYYALYSIPCNPDFDCPTYPSYNFLSEQYYNPSTLELLLRFNL